MAFPFQHRKRFDVEGAGEHIVRADERGGIFFAEKGEVAR